MTATTHTHRPRRCTEPELKKVNIHLIDRTENRPECQNCGRQWSPLLGRDGRMPRGYRRCPEGCNSSE